MQETGASQALATGLSNCWIPALKKIMKCQITLTKPIVPASYFSLTFIVWRIGITHSEHISNAASDKSFDLSTTMGVEKGLDKSLRETVQLWRVDILQTITLPKALRASLSRQNAWCALIGIHDIFISSSETKAQLHKNNPIIYL